MEKCDVCGKELKFVGVQKLPKQGFEYDLMHCDDKDCSGYTLTQTYNIVITDQKLYDEYLIRTSKFKK